MFCREQVAQLRDIFPAIEAAGAELIVVGNGTPAMLEAFTEDFGAGLRHTYTDPSLRVYEALGARRGSALFFLDPRVWLNSLRALLGRFLPGRVQGDAGQLGGVWVVRPGGDAVFEYRSRVAGDYPSNTDVVEAVSRL
jgi:hypothetical protein